MSNNPEAHRSCPRCSGEMVLRLDEFECTDCGFFISAEKMLQADATEPSRVARRISDAGKVLPGSRGGRGGGLYALDRPTASFATRWMKAIFLVVTFAEMTGMNLLVRHADPNLDVTPVFIRTVVFAAFLLVGITSIALYIDWSGFKKFSIICAVLTLAIYCVHGYLVWKTASNELSVQLILDALLLSWFIFILLSDIIKSR